MTAAATEAGDTLYWERPRCPVWVYLGFFLVPAGFTAALFVVFRMVSSGGDYWSGGAIMLAVSALSGALPRFSQRPIIVDELGLHLGRQLIPIHQITMMRAASGHELRLLRHEIADIGDAWIGLTGIGPLSFGLASIAAGISLMGSEDRRRGMLCSPWQEPALLVETPGLQTKRWLISARNPQRLEEAIESRQSVPWPPTFDSGVESRSTRTASVAISETLARLEQLRRGKQ
jgi:hypothetical protein